MRIVFPLILLGTLTAAGAEGVFGIWRVNLARSSPFSDLVEVKFEPHSRGEIFTVEKPHELVLVITEQHLAGWSADRRLLLEKRIRREFINE